MKHAISIEALSKQYAIGAKQQQNRNFREAIAGAFLAPFHRLQRLGGKVAEEDLIWALTDVSFAVGQGEVVGIVGHNGAGKSTLLKILARITDPTSGRVTLRGRVASLLEVGTGFHPELTGRENIYLNGAILGMSRAEIRKKFDEMIDFAGIEKFLDTPVKHYSSGMQMRLAFAVAAHLEAEVLLIDEVLAVGDAEFQRKCLGKMSDVANSGRTILFVSHNMAAVEGLCSRCVMLRSGKLIDDGPTDRILSAYTSAIGALQRNSEDLTHHSGRPAGTETLMRSVRLRDKSGENVGAIDIGEDLTVEVGFRRPELEFSPVLGVVIRNAFGAPVFSLDNRFVPGFDFEAVNEGTISCRIPKLPLVPGRYIIDLYLGDRSRSIDKVAGAASFDVMERDFYNSGRMPGPLRGAFFWQGEWSLRTAETEDVRREAS